MFSDYGPSSVHEHLYDVVATPTGVRLSPNSEKGHELVVDLMTRLGLFAESRSIPMVTLGPTCSPELSMSASIVPTPPAASVESPTRTAREAHGPVEPVTDQPLDGAAAGLSLCALTDLHLRNMNLGGLKERSAVRERRYVLDLLVQIIGDKPVADITTTDAANFAETLAQWPSYRHNKPDFAHMSPAAILKRTHDLELPTIQRSTQAKHIKALNAFFAWCVESEAIRLSPFRLIELSRYRELIPRKKEPFTEENLQVLFARDRMTACDAPHKFWVPLIALYSGMRVNEISQMYLQDLKTERVRDAQGVDHSILCFEVTSHRKNQRIKSPYSQRMVPVHSSLLKLGFADYVEDVRRSGSEHLFPGLNWSGDGPGRATTQWFNGPHLRKQCGIDTPLKTLHCFRHTINTLADRSCIPDSIMQTINGHTSGEGVRARAYVARGTLLECQRAIEQLPFPQLDVAPYETGRFTPYLERSKSRGDHQTRQQKAGISASRARGRPPKVNAAIP
jgi:integrase